MNSSRTIWWYVFRGAFFAVVMALCCPSEGAELTKVASRPILILEPVTSNATAAASLKILREVFPGAQTIQAGGFSNRMAEASTTGAILIVPDVARVPIELWPSLQDYLNQGGRAVFVGCNPFEARTQWNNEKPIDEAEFLRNLPARSVDGLSAVAEWRHESDQSNELKRAVCSQPGTENCLVTVENFRDWDALIRDNIPSETISNSENTLVFTASGDTNTSRLAVICVEPDDSHWFYVASLGASQPYAVHEAKFQYFYGGWNRGKPGDHLTLAKAKKISVGLSMYLGAQTPGRHSYGISNIRLARDPRPVSEVIGWPNIMLLSPPYRHYTFTDPKLGTMQSPLPRARGPGAPYRWTPEAPVTDSHGTVLGWPASTYFEPGDGPVKKAWAWVGMDPDDRNQRKLGQMLQACVDRVASESVPPPQSCPRPQAVRQAKDDDWITVNNGLFRYQGKPIFLAGINYWPLSHNGIAPGEFSAHWLEPSVFDLEVVQRDLDRLREVGINAVSIQYLSETQALQLQVFVEECRKRGIWVHVFVAYLQPLDQNLATAKRLIEAAELKNLPGVFAIDVAWEPHLGNYAERSRFDADWEAWLTEQYGSVGHAEKVIGRPLWSKDGNVTGPTDEELRTDGSHRVAVATYRRFVDDYMSRRYGEVERLVRRLGCKQLLSARSGYGGTGSHWADAVFPIDLATGVVHFDFTSPEGYALSGEPTQFQEGTFLTAYARGVADGKPVAWLEFGCNIGVNPQTPDLENQARLYRNMLELARASHAAGLFGWWYPSGWRVDERSDMGVVNPDSTWRPVGEVYRSFHERAAREVTSPAPWRGREIHRDADARGVSSLWDHWRDTYREETRKGRMEEVRPANFGKLTTEIPILSVGEVTYDAPAPLEFVNAEWGRVLIDGVEQERKPGKPLVVGLGHELKLELINTGPARWVTAEKDKPHTVLVQAESMESGSQSLEVDGLSFGQRTWITWTAPKAGTWHLRPLLKNVGVFGEPLDLEISENKK